MFSPGSEDAAEGKVGNTLSMRGIQSLVVRVAWKIWEEIQAASRKDL